MDKRTEWLEGILANPDASENEWLGAAHKLDRQASERNLVPCRSTLIGLGATLFAVASCFFMRIGFDWGYDAIDAAFTQPQTQAVHQGLTASFAIPHIVLPLLLGISLAFAKRFAGGEKRWLGLLLSLIVALAGFYNFEFPAAQNTLAKAIFLVTLSCIVGLSAFTFGHRLAAKAAGCWRSKAGFVPVDLIKGLAIYAVPAGIYGVLSLWDSTRVELPYVAEVIMYSGLLGLVGVFCAAHSRSAALAFSRSFIVVSPIICANALNVALNLGSLLLDTVSLGADLGWRSLLSALLILLVTSTSPVWGMALGLWYRNRAR